MGARISLHVRGDPKIDLVSDAVSIGEDIEISHLTDEDFDDIFSEQSTDASDTDGKPDQ